MTSASVGATLRAERERQARSLAELAQRTRISAKFLNDIETDNFDALPGLVFTRNFVKSYASELGLDPDPFVSALPRVQVSESPVAIPPIRETPENWDPRWNSSLSSVAWIAVALAAAIFAYFHFNRPAANLPSKAVVAPQSVQQPGNQIVKQDAGPEPAQQQPPKEEQAPAAASPRPAVPADASGPASTPSPDEHPVQVVLTGNQRSWVQITADGKNVFSGMLRADEKREVLADDFVKVVMGNAGGVTISLNGKRLDPLGPAGEVRTVKLTAEGPPLVSRVPPPIYDPL